MKSVQTADAVHTLRCAFQISVWHRFDMCTIDSSNVSARMIDELLSPNRLVNHGHSVMYTDRALQKNPACCEWTIVHFETRLLLHHPRTRLSDRCGREVRDQYEVVLLTRPKPPKAVQQWGRLSSDDTFSAMGIVLVRDGPATIYPTA